MTDNLFSSVKKLEQKNALKDCPFCGGKAHCCKDDYDLWYVGCLKCDATGWSSKHKSNAISAWNTRFESEIDFTKHVRKGMEDKDSVTLIREIREGGKI